MLLSKSKIQTKRGCEQLDKLEAKKNPKKNIYSPWASPTVYLKKKNKIRVCADHLTGLNDCLKQTNYPLPLVDGIFTQLNVGWIFSKLDLLEAYLQIPVDEKCAEILMNTYKGLYKFLKLPFGINIVLAIFQQIIDTMLCGLHLAIGYLDDILIKSKMLEEHVRHVKEVFQKTRV